MKLLNLKITRSQNTLLLLFSMFVGINGFANSTSDCINNNVLKSINDAILSGPTNVNLGEEHAYHLVDKPALGAHLGIAWVFTKTTSDGDQVSFEREMSNFDQDYKIRWDTPGKIELKAIYFDSVGRTHESNTLLINVIPPTSLSGPTSITQGEEHSYYLVDKEIYGPNMGVVWQFTKKTSGGNQITYQREMSDYDKDYKIVWDTPGEIELKALYFDFDKTIESNTLLVTVTPTELSGPSNVFVGEEHTYHLLDVTSTAAPYGLVWVFTTNTGNGEEVRYERDHSGLDDYKITWDTTGEVELKVMYFNQDGQQYTNTLDIKVSRKWYKDVDEDGLGDPDTLLILTGNPPFGYVSNGDDRCPLIEGSIENNGCLPVSTIENDHNYIWKTIPQEPVRLIHASSDKIESVAYFDGLGRPNQTVNVKAGNNSQDVVSIVKYDDKGRQYKDFLAYAATTNNGFYKPDAFTSTKAFYKTVKYENTTNPYSEKLFEPSPLNRVSKQAAPGTSWALGRGHEIEFDYQNNTTADAVKNFRVSLVFNGETYTPTLIGGTTNYEAGKLFKSITKDENHVDEATKDHTSQEFKDKQGRVILKRTYDNEVSHDTYYVYDYYGNLTYVFPPKVYTTDGVSAAELAGLCYQYIYDYRNRLVEKKIPGKDWEYIVYNKLDQPVLTQDALLRENKEWLFTKYDAFGRVVYAGKYTATGTDVERVDLQSQVDAIATLFETAQTSERDLGDANIFYTNNSFPQSNIEIYTVNYYDDYRFTSITNAPTAVFGQARSTDDKSLPTGSLVKVLQTNDWITSYTLYDKKARSIYTYSENSYLNTKDEIKTEYDFVGKVLKTRSSHTKDTNEPIVTQDVFTYDHVGRLIDQHQCIGDASLDEDCGSQVVSEHPDNLELNESVTTSAVEKANNSIIIKPGFIADAESSASFRFEASISKASETGELIASNTYDELGQLESKKVGNSTEAPLQTVDYTYNIRGWLKTINDPNTALGDDLFSFKLNYNTTEITGSKALYNGNISETHWKTANDNSLRNYKYSYDAINRIKSAIDNTENYSLKYVEYDFNGNISFLQRYGHLNDNATNFGLMDHLFYSYDQNSNQLIAVSDRLFSSPEQANYGFKDGNTSIDDYEYDANGNMISDANKGITAITYNHLNLPKTVAINNSEGAGIISYIYNATGTKLSKVVTAGSSFTNTDYAGNYVYENDELKFGNHAEGYIEPTNGIDAEDGFKYVYQFKDHLGNIRLSYADDNEDGEIAVSEIREEKNYYPLGLKHKGYNSEKRGRVHNYGYNGKEENDELGLNQLDYGARFYDPALGKWFTPDALAEKYLDQSPYNYALNNPIIYIDPDGNQVEMCCQKLKDFIFNDTGRGKPVLTMGLHHIELPLAQRADGDFAGNVVKSIYNGVAGTWNAGMQGENMGDITTQGFNQMGKMADRITHGEATVEDYESVAAMVLVRKAKGKTLKNPGRSGKQARLKELSTDPKLGKADKGWIKQEMNSVKRGSKRMGRDGSLRPQKNLRNPPGKDLAHPYKQRAKDGNSYKDANLKNKSDHIKEHQIQGYK